MKSKNPTKTQLIHKIAHSIQSYSTKEICFEYSNFKQGCRLGHIITVLDHFISMEMQEEKNVLDFTKSTVKQHTIIDEGVPAVSYAIV